MLADYQALVKWVQINRNLTAKKVVCSSAKFERQGEAPGKPAKFAGKERSEKIGSRPPNRFMFSSCAAEFLA
jgi:hypothetical protein